MKVINWPKEKYDWQSSGCIATIGVFDGVHCGHRRLLFELVSQAEERGRQSVVITFDRAVNEALGRKEKAEFITSLDHRLKLFAKLGVDATVVITFTRDLASMSAREFAVRVLKEAMNVEKLLLGFDGRFGRDGKGGIDICDNVGLKAQRIAPVKIDGEVVSSTAIRDALKRGDLVRASKLLGRPYSLIGVVEHGDSLGTDIGYPTANLNPDNELLPMEGVYAGRTCIGENLYDSAISVGKRPTVHGKDADRVVVEIYLIDEKMDLYGRELEVQFFNFLREQKNFAKIADLKTQISRDVQRCRELLNTRLRQT